MTGARFNKYRYYAPRVFEAESTRPDFNERAVAFKAISGILSKQASLNANVSAAAMPKKGNTDGKKRTQGENANKERTGIIWDPSAKRKPGQFFKHWVTDREAFMASQGLDTEPNYGWVSPKKTSFMEARDSLVNGPQVEITKHKINPKTGQINKTPIEVKALGRSIGERNPAGKLVNRAAVRAGMVVDALGRLRCPPGVPAANQFTDAQGSNCFTLSVADIGNIISEISQAFSGRPTLSSVGIAAVNVAEVVSVRRV